MESRGEYVESVVVDENALYIGVGRDSVRIMQCSFSVVAAVVIAQH